MVHVKVDRGYLPVPTEVHPEGVAFSQVDGLLTIYDSNDHVIAMYNRSQWSSIEVVPETKVVSGCDPRACKCGCK